MSLGKIINQFRRSLPTFTVAITTFTYINSLLPVQAAPVTAKSADSFVNSMCVNTHLGYTDTPYVRQYNTVKQKLVEMGIRHIRDGGSREDVIAKMKDLAAVGIKTTYIMNPQAGVAPNSSYWATAPNYNINDFVKNKVGTNVIDAVEILNEIDLFHNLHGGYYWRPYDTHKINDNPKSSLYWAKYATSMTKATWKALKSDPATANVKVIGPSLGRTYDYKNKPPLGDLSAYVNWGNFHPYPYGGNSFSYPFSYNTIDKYFWQGNFPSVNIDERPYAFDMTKHIFGLKPMAATETGYFTTETEYGISEEMHGKYMPRVFLEYFRKGIARTCSYEFVDEWDAPSNREANFGLLRNDLSPKPAYTALRNMIGLLKDPGTNFTLGTLDYTLDVTPPQAYTREKYVKSLLLQKRDGDFYLVLWHDISNGDTTSTPVREIEPPPMPTQIQLNTPIANATVYSLDDLGNMSMYNATINGNTINVAVTDKAMMVKLMPYK
ncbi:hypothetical protein [Gloeocapsopsis dulcis]|uniref:Uncharacterized protein n=1 Tax=Gloeocapsopsis dulcis AAB1 = 1H9 TaxID=1433147 RepID=A0A6N8FRH0_9CHRO|nr:hypothetical protein [Gloeocapsopsis dulcis]MUL35703.1 hypothetical protein [Gloeocapsopsis dulcis AAB1 = 1H9]WNN91014.1 hypothetical protein P0S91_08040 [Gloeocapsopsis dulcis]